MGILRTYNTAAVTYATMCPDKGYPSTAADLGPGSGDCSHANLVDGILAESKSFRHGYVFIYQAQGTDRGGHVTGYAVSADPLQPGVSGARHFYTDQTGIIRVQNNAGANSDSPPL